MGDLSAAALHDLLERMTHANDQVDRCSIRATDYQKPGDYFEVLVSHTDAAPQSILAWGLTRFTMETLA